MGTHHHRPVTGDTQPLDIEALHDWIEAARRPRYDDDPRGALALTLAEMRAFRRWLAEHGWEEELC